MPSLYSQRNITNLAARFGVNKSAIECEKELKVLGLTEGQIKELSDNIRATINRILDEPHNNEQ